MRHPTAAARRHAHRVPFRVAERAAVDQALVRLVRAGTLIRVRRGQYHMPRVNERLGITLPPDADAVADAVGRQTGSAVAPSDAVVANRLGLSTQVPAKHVYMTTGRSRVMRVGGQTIRFRRVSSRQRRAFARYAQYDTHWIAASARRVLADPSKARG